MSPTMDNFVGSLVEMAKAYEENPKLHEQIDTLRHESEQRRMTIASREEAIVGYKAEIEALQAKLRSVEAERDNASFRVLEVEDTFNKVFSTAGALLSAANKVQDILHPPKPVEEQVPEPAEWSGSFDPTSPDTHWIDDKTGERKAAEPAPMSATAKQFEPIMGQSAVDPTIAHTPGSVIATPTSHEAAPATSASTAASTSTEGQSASHPTVATTESTSGSAHSTAGNTDTAEALQPTGEVPYTPQPETPAEASPANPAVAYPPEPTSARDGNGYITAAWWNWYDNHPDHEAREAAFRKL